MGLHEDLHAATQVPAQLVGSAAACMRWWRLSQCGPDGGPAGVLGKGLAEAPAVIPGKALAGGLVVFLGWDPAKGCRLLSAYLILNVFTKICMPPRGCLPNPCPFGGSGLKGDLLRRRGTSRRGKGLAGAARTVSRQGSCRGSPLRPLCSSWSWRWRRSSLELRSYPG